MRKALYIFALLVVAAMANAGVYVYGPVQSWANPSAHFYVAQYAANTNSGGNTSPNGSTRSMSISFGGYSRTETLTNFPALVTLTNGSPSGFAFSDFASTNGYDLRFSADSAGSSLLNYEIDTWATSATSYVWVQVPILTNNALIYAWWGGTGTAQQAYTTNGATWSNSYKAVYHLPNGSTLTAKDSTASGANGTINGAQPASGVVNGGASFSSGTRDITSTSSALNFSGPVTLSAWAFPTIKNQYQLLIGRTSGPNQRSYAFFLSGAGVNNIFLSVNNGAFNADIPLSIPWATNAWNHVEATADGTYLKIYVNGQLSGIVTNATTANNNSSATMYLGYDGGNSSYEMYGSLDEARISAAARDANWIWAEYMNMASNSTFQTLGTVTSH